MHPVGQTGDCLLTARNTGKKGKRRNVEVKQNRERQEARRGELRKTLCERLEKLRRNLELYPRQVLKTVYRKGYEALSREIGALLTEYVSETAFCGFYPLKSDVEEISAAVYRVVKESGIQSEISAAAYERQDINEIDRLAEKMRRLTEAAMEPFYPRYICLYLKDDCFDDPPACPEIRNLLTGCVWQNGRWIRKERENK